MTEDSDYKLAELSGKYPIDVRDKTVSASKVIDYDKVEKAFPVENSSVLYAILANATTTEKIKD